MLPLATGCKGEFVYDLIYSLVEIRRPLESMLLHKYESSVTEDLGLVNTIIFVKSD